MSLQGPIPVEFGHVFTHGAYAAGVFEAVRDFDASTGDRFVQSKDKTTGLPLWAIETSDAVKLSSCWRRFLLSGCGGQGLGGREGDGLVVVLAGEQAVVQAAEHAAEQVPLRGGVPVAGVAAAVVVAAGAR